METNGAKPQRPSWWVIVGGAAAVVVLLGVLGSGSFSGSDEQGLPTTVPSVTSEPTGTTAVGISLPESAQPTTTPTEREWEEIVVRADEFVSERSWTRVGLPDGVDAIVEIGRFEEQIAIVGGHRRSDGNIVDALFAIWDGDDWRETTTITSGNQTVSFASIESTGIVVAGFEGLAGVVGETSVWWSTNGSNFGHQILASGSPDQTLLEISHVAIDGSDVWAFGAAGRTGWEPVMDRLPTALGALLSRVVKPISAEMAKTWTCGYEEARPLRRSRWRNWVSTFLRRRLPAVATSLGGAIW